MKRVLFLEAEVKHYRLPFLLRLSELLREDGIELRAASGRAGGREKTRQDQVVVPPPLGVEVKNIWLLGGRLLWQRAISIVRQSDLVIVDQGNKNLINFGLLGLSQLGLKKVAFFGHGRNRQQTGSPLSEWVKRKTINAVNGWFAYTAGTRDYLIAQGVPEMKITVANNSTDTETFREELASISETETQRLRDHLGIPTPAWVALYCGAISADKRIESLIAAAVETQKQIPEFHLLVVGTGPQKEQLAEWARGHPFIHLVGPHMGRDKAAYFKLANVFFHPGAIGLAVLDAFTAGLPILTTTLEVHGPEIEYLRPGENGQRVPCNPTALAAELRRWHAQPELLKRMQESALKSATLYGIEGMANRFRQGILKLLAS